MLSCLAYCGCSLTQGTVLILMFKFQLRDVAVWPDTFGYMLIMWNMNAKFVGKHKIINMLESEVQKYIFFRRSAKIHKDS